MKSILNYPHIGIFIIAWFVADLLIPSLIRAGHKMRILDRPGGHKGQKNPIPFFGGFAIFTAFTVSICSTLRFTSVESFTPFMGMLLGATMMVALGLIDDVRPINAIVKLVAIFIATVILASFGIALSLFPPTFFNLLNIVVTMIWIAGITSAMNSLDNTDGVAGGTAAIAALFTFVIAWGTSSADAQPWLSYLAVSLAGASIGFLRYNFAPAKIYLGDNGAFFLGYALATILVFGHYSTDPLKAILIPCLILSVPIFDITLSTILRWRDGDVKTFREAVLYCGRDHVAHLLMGLNLTKRQAACVLYAIGVVGGLVALIVLNVTTVGFYLSITGMYLALLTALGVILGRVRRQVVAEEKSVERPIQHPLTRSVRRTMKKLTP